MQTKNWEDELKEGGYTPMHSHHDGPDFEYSEHEHPVDMAHVILEGSMTIWINDKKITVVRGQIIKIPKLCSHRVQVGAEGCTYVNAVRI